MGPQTVQPTPHQVCPGLTWKPEVFKVGPTFMVLSQKAAHLGMEPLIQVKSYKGKNDSHHSQNCLHKERAKHTG